MVDLVKQKNGTVLIRLMIQGARVFYRLPQMVEQASNLDTIHHPVIQGST